MRKHPKKLLCLFISVIMISGTCASIIEYALFHQKPQFVIDDIDATLRIEIIGAFSDLYIFALTPENTLLSQYNEFSDGSGRFEQSEIVLNKMQVSMIEHYLNETKKDIIERDISGGALFSDYYYERMYINNELIMFTYGTSESTSANLLTEIIIGCSNLKILKHKHYSLEPAGVAYRSIAEELAAID